MDIQEHWEKALKQTEIIRPRVQPLETFKATHVPYIFLAASSVNRGDTVVRKGEVVVEKPSIVMPFNMPHFEGFQFDEDLKVSEDNLKTFFLVRGVSFPSLKFNNKTASLDIREGRLSSAIEHYSRVLSVDENVQAGLLTGPEDSWQFSLLIFVCAQMSKSADNDVKRLFEEYKRRFDK